MAMIPDTLNHILQNLSLRDYGEAMRNYVIRNFAEKNLPELHKARMEKLQRPWLCIWYVRDRYGRLGRASSLYVMAPDRAIAFWALVREDPDPFIDILENSAYETQAQTAAVIDEGVRQLYIDLDNAAQQGNVALFLHIIHDDPRSERVLQRCYNLSNREHRPESLAEDWTIISIDKVKHVRAL